MPRPQPVRTCIACRQTGDKRELVRVVRTATGVVVDPTGKQAGRGAYVHQTLSCWQILFQKRGLLANALKYELQPVDFERLQLYCARFTSV
jgi:predicted RNA-binding protein YlxR (DUF448 family)